MDSDGKKIELTAEEQFLWQCARLWRDPADLGPQPELDWRRLVDTAVANRLQLPLTHVLQSTGQLDTLPDDAAETLSHGVQKNVALSQLLEPALNQYLNHAESIDQEVIVIKGLWLSDKIYGLKSFRPGADIDILLRRSDIPASLAILEDEMDYGRWWRPLLDDRFYDRHHLHQQRCNYNRAIWFEPHWMLDHPYTRLTVDYEALMDRTQPGTLLGKPVRELNPADLLLSLAIHLVKHAVYLPSVLDRPDLARLILADDMLMYFVDVAEVIRHYQDRLDWHLTGRLAQSWGAGDILGSVLWVCHDYLHASVPAWVLETLMPGPVGPITGRVMHRLADYKIDVYLGRRPSRLWGVLLGYNAAIVFRPIRLLDLFHYLVPGNDFLERRYGRAGWTKAVAHFLRAVGQYVRVGFDTVRFTWLRRREVRELDRQGYYWPGPPPKLG